MHVTLFREYSCYIKEQEKGTTASDNASTAWQVQDTGRNCRQISKPFRCIQHSGGRRFVISERCQSTWTTIFTLIPQVGEEEKVLYISLHWLRSLKNSFTFRPNFLFLCLYTSIRGISFSFQLIRKPTLESFRSMLEMFKGHLCVHWGERGFHNRPTEDIVGGKPGKGPQDPQLHSPTHIAPHTDGAEGLFATRVNGGP